MPPVDLQQLWAQGGEQRSEHRAIDGYAITLLASIGVILGLAATAADHFHTAHAAPVFKYFLFAGLGILILAILLLAAIFLLAVLHWPRRDDRPWSIATDVQHELSYEESLAALTHGLEVERARLVRRRLVFRAGVSLFAASLVWFGIVVTSGIGTGEIKVGGMSVTGGTGGKGGTGGTGGKGGTSGPLKVTVHVVGDDDAAE